ncbi:MAG: hypothetical protein A2060_04070 [Planctomycetes bacterium GWA2_50_13]|nr:MAG: hypothetical protein A2060_04070 [Planctomycetes bacterium GWA2_50_13]OHB95880.1 MAG: hypothetical protein A3I59_01875 [Planctomycetes bacterium RIFCSPLOWO2_02_FULL_50_16]OHC03339.1 MAG: hypothetical protein A3G17_00080 [Planctomycetes bacterium RIFCSPLOWO2_12_FULL_50_35]HCN19238.1 hypothetical protein [Planctomycetia bacterium]
MGKTRLRGILPVLRKLILFILCSSVLSFVLFTCVSYAGLFSSEKSTEEIAREYGQAVVFITAFDKDGKILGEGSGFVADPKGIIITNHHCIEGADTVKVRLTNGAYYDVEGTLGVDKDWDIAILKIKAKNLPSAPLGDSDKLSVGE